jgi:Uncharacterized protein conserved in bacteria (DUF2272)
MSVKDDIRWFKDQFADDVIPSLAGTPISFDLICAIAFQETGELWSRLRLHQPALSREELLRLTVGDTLDAPNRSAFPKNKEELVAAPKGQPMFNLAHKLLGEMGDATGIEVYQRLARNPEKLVHGYGIFQYDLQFFREDPDFFLKQQWKNIDACVEKLMKELKKALAQLHFSNQSSLTTLQSDFVAIVYNTGFGNFDERKGLKQGHEDNGVFYGENIDRFLQIARTIPTPGTVAIAGGGAQAAAVGRSIVAIAKNEFDRFHSFKEGQEPLRSRIADYYEAAGGSRNLDPTLNVNAWSAAFVSFCVKQSGATSSQFEFSMQHSVFIHAAIANANANRGVFRGHRITEYAPKLGDLIHHNRDGSSLADFEFAQTHADYPSHSAIVIDLDTHNGGRRAVTMGGNESNSIGQSFFALDGSGFLDQSKIAQKLICVVENQLAAGATAMPLGPYVVSVRTDLKLRGGPGSDFAIIKSLVDGTRLNVLSFDDEPSGRWALVDLEGDGVKDGFVFASFIEPILG